VYNANRQAEDLAIGGGFQGMITKTAMGLAYPLHANLRMAAPELRGLGEGGIAEFTQRQRKEPVIELGHGRQRNAVSNGSLRSLRIALRSPPTSSSLADEGRVGSLLCAFARSAR
jgi:hypothetical protein